MFLNPFAASVQYVQVCDATGAPCCYQCRLQKNKKAIPKGQLLLKGF